MKKLPMTTAVLCALATAAPVFAGARQVYSVEGADAVI